MSGEKSEEMFDAAAVAELGLSAPAAEPPPRLRAKLLDRLRHVAAGDGRPADPSRPEGAFEVVPGVLAVRTGNARWLPSGLAGIEYKLLARDEARRTTTRLVRFQAGSRYPTHRHGDVEEIFLIEGSIWVNGTLLKPGDYCRSEAGTEESGTYTDEGGVAIVVSSDHDEVSPAG